MTAECGKAVIQTVTRTYVHWLEQHADNDVTAEQVLAAVAAARAAGMPLDSSVDVGSTRVRFVHVAVVER